MDVLFGMLFGSIITALVMGVSIAYWYIDTTEGWDHKPTHDEIGQRIIEAYILEEVNHENR